MKHDTPTATRLTIGMDIGDRRCHICVLNDSRQIVRERRLSTTEQAIHKEFGALSPARIVLEVGPHSRWIATLLADLGHDVLVVDPRRIHLISRSDSKTDRRDAEILARLALGAPELLGEIRHRPATLQADLSLLKSRDILVSQRTQLVNRIRGIAKANGSRLPSCSATYFHRKVAEHLPDELRSACAPLFGMLRCIYTEIRALDRQIKELAQERYPDTKLLSQVNGVGDLTALAFVLILESPHRFRSSRQVGSYLGLRPRKDESGDRDLQLRITKAGNPYLRRLLVNCAHYILGPFGKDCDLRRCGLAICEKGGRNAKKRAVIAVARKLAVLLHRLWATPQVYDPLANSRPPQERVA